MRTAVLALVRAYQDGGRPQVQSAETHLQEVTDLPDPDGGTDASDPCMPRSLCRVLSVALIPHAAGSGDPSGAHALRRVSSLVRDCRSPAVPMLVRNASWVRNRLARRCACQ
ncbi:MAG: hypothetical protein QOH97_1249 [Actinoplanes sp.]|jgi:hypothetical protein|nr:hypothetical protein [Actinoplanes sp.]